LCVGMLSSCVGLLEELRHEISVGDTTLAKVTVKVIMRGKQGAGKSSFVAACCGDAVLGDDYMKTVGLQVRTCLWPIKVGTRLRAPCAPTSSSVSYSHACGMVPSIPPMWPDRG